jgi:hypothetical protein
VFWFNSLVRRTLRFVRSSIHVDPLLFFLACSWGTKGSSPCVYPVLHILNHPLSSTRKRQRPVPHPLLSLSTTQPLIPLPLLCRTADALPSISSKKDGEKANIVEEIQKSTEDLDKAFAETVKKALTPVKTVEAAEPPNAEDDNKVRYIYDKSLVVASSRRLPLFPLQTFRTRLVACW